jgi:hypothetical protein
MLLNMNPQYIALPSGLVINFEHVAFISPVEGELDVCFTATYQSAPLKLRVQKDDVNAFLERLVALGINIEHLVAAISKKTIEE